MENIHDIVYSEKALHFVKIAKQYADLLDENEYPERNQFVLELLKTIPLLYSAIIDVPVEEAVYDDENEKFVTEEEWSAIFQKIAALMGAQNEYIDVPDNDEYDTMDVISRSLSEDIADIYQDIRDFLELYRNGTEEVMNDALWECKINFERYWGIKAARVIAVLHKILLTDPEELDKKENEWKEKHSKRKFNTDKWFISQRQKDTNRDEDI